MTDTETPETEGAAGRVAQFPAGFVWGVATSAFQIEGAAEADGRGESIWDRFCAQPGAIADASNGLVACDHYHRYEDDVALMADLGVSAYRFSISWPRIHPDGTERVNRAGLDFYDRLVDAVLAAGLTPYPTLYHWDLPQALEDRGGWVERATTDAFCRYVDTVVGRLGDRVGTWVTLNEPFVSAGHGYLEGVHAPGRQSLADCLAAAHHLLLAHGRAVPRIRSLAPSAQVGIVLNFTPRQPRSEDAADVAAAELADGFENRWYVEPIAGAGYPAETVAALEWDQREVAPGDLDTIAAPIDVLGINYYCRQIEAAGGPVTEPILPTTDMGWEIYPQGLRETITRIHTNHGFPSYLVTENGAAFADVADDDGFVDDNDRIDYVADHLIELDAARRSGVPVQGYFLWSLLDNFEWAWGYDKRFGIVRVDYDTLARIPKASARWYANVARTGRVERL